MATGSLFVGMAGVGRARFTCGCVAAAAAAFASMVIISIDKCGEESQERCMYTAYAATTTYIEHSTQSQLSSYTGELVGVAVRR